MRIVFAGQALATTPHGQLGGVEGRKYPSVRLWLVVIRVPNLSSRLETQHQGENTVGPQSPDAPLEQRIRHLQALITLLTTQIGSAESLSSQPLIHPNNAELEDDSNEVDSEVDEKDDISAPKSFLGTARQDLKQLQTPTRDIFDAADALENLQHLDHSFKKGERVISGRKSKQRNERLYDGKFFIPPEEDKPRIMKCDD